MTYRLAPQFEAAVGAMPAARLAALHNIAVWSLALSRDAERQTAIRSRVDAELMRRGFAVTPDKRITP